MGNKHKNFKNFKNKKLYKKRKIINKEKLKNSQEIDLKKKNFKFIKRSKESVEALRRQKLLEDKYKNESKNCEEQYSSDADDENNEEENPYNQLVENFQKKDGNKNRVIESSSSSNEDEDDDDNHDNVGDNNLNRRIEEEEEINEYFDDEVDGESIHLHFSDSEDDIKPDISQIKLKMDDDIKNDQNQNPEGDSNENNEIIIEEELNEEIEKLENSKDKHITDTFTKHLDYELSEEHIDNLLKKPINIKTIRHNWPIIGNLIIEISKKSLTTNDDNNHCPKKKIKKNFLDDENMYADEGEPPVLIDHKNFEWNEHNIKSQIGKNISIANANNLNAESLSLTALQAEIFSIMNNYQDLFYSHRTLDNGEEIRFIYCLHALNHMLKTRTKILHHNAKLSANTNRKKQQKNAIVPDMYKDQGLVRPKILILVPFRESAFRVVNCLISLFFGENSEKMKTSGGVINYKRFKEEYTGDTLRFPKHNPKPEDYEKIFAGNTDDTFRIGISLTKKCIKLYTEFYSSDILIASPLGLRMIIGAPGDKERDYDFLSSIEILILDQIELFFAQNWDHLLHIFDHFHLQPQSVRNTDFSRVRSWCLNGLSKFYRQTLLFSSHELSEFRSLYNSKCFNYRGKIRTINPIINGTIKNVVVQIPQTFHKIEVTSIESSFDTRFKYFTNDILPQYKSSSMSHCMILVPSYFDYVRLRNYFKSETINFVQICEYTNDKKIARARDMFYHSSSHFLLYSERSHFFRRTRIKGIRHLIMYQPPYSPNFYSEIINFMQDGNQNQLDGLESSMSITILYTKYDTLQISSIIGTERAKKILNSNKQTHIFMSED